MLFQDDHLDRALLAVDPSLLSLISSVCVSRWWYKAKFDCLIMMLRSKILELRNRAVNYVSSKTSRIVNRRKLEDILERTLLRIREICLALPVYGPDFYRLWTPIQLVLGPIVLFYLLWFNVIKSMCLPIYRLFFAQKHPTLLQTGKNQFERLGQEYGFDFPTYFIPVQDGTSYEVPRMHFVDTGPREAEETIILIHGDLTWSFLYRKVIPQLTRYGFRVIAPDLVGYGKSDKFTDPKMYSLELHVNSIIRLVQHLDITNVTLVGYETGGNVGLCASSQLNDRIKSIVVINSSFPVGDLLTDSYESKLIASPYHRVLSLLPQLIWKYYMKLVGDVVPVRVIQDLNCKKVQSRVAEIYAKPYLTTEYQMGLYATSQFYPIFRDDASVALNQQARNVMKSWSKSALTILTLKDRVILSEGRLASQLLTSNTSKTVVWAQAKGLIPDTYGEELGKVLVDFMNEDLE